MQIDQDAHQLGDRDRRMRVVQLDRDLVGQNTDVAILLAHVPRDEIQERGGGEEIFLAQTQLLARRRLVARVKHL